MGGNNHDIYMNAPDKSHTREQDYSHAGEFRPACFRSLDERETWYGGDNIALCGVTIASSRKRGDPHLLSAGRREYHKVVADNPHRRTKRLFRPKGLITVRGASNFFVSH